MWNYRILKHIDDDVEYYGLHEVYYEDKKPTDCTEKSIDLSNFESAEEMIKSLEMMLEDAKLYKDDIISYDYFDSLEDG